jgi:hypothetical protein
VKKNNNIKAIAQCIWVTLIISSFLLTSMGPVGSGQAAAARVAYIYLLDTTTRDQFITMLTGKGITVDAYTLTEAATADFTQDQTIILADDSGGLGGFPPGTFNNIQTYAKPVLGIGLGGVVFFGQAGVTMAQGGTTTATAYDVHAADIYAPIWQTPNQVSLLNQVMSAYTAAVSIYAYYTPDPIQFVNRIGRLVGNVNYYDLMAQNIGGGGGVCYAFWGFRGSAASMTPSGANLFVNMALGSPCTAGTYTLNASLAGTPPAIDGVLNYGEWSLTPNRLELDHGFVAAMNDNLRLYLLLDVLESNVNNSGVNPNDFWVTFDVNNDAQITPSVDMNYAMEAGTYNMRYQHYINPAQWDFLSATTKSSLGPGFDCYTPDLTKILNIITLQFDCDAHQIWEIAIDLHEINALPGQTIHLGLRTHSPNPNFTDEWPNALDVDFSNLIALHLAGASIPNPTPGASIDFATPPFEITQVVQDANNSIQLIADKTTAGRVSVHTTGASSLQPVIEYLYGVNVSGGADLPGSPLAQLILAPPAVDRGKLADTANFLLPPSWTGQGEVIFHAEASDYNGHNISSGTKVLNFQHRNKPVYWMIQENFGTVNTPDLLAQATLNSFESYTNAVFPVPDITWVQKPWTVLGALNGMTDDKNVAAVQKYYANTSAIYWTLINQNKVPPFALPDLIFGAANKGGAISDPTWDNNGAGHAAAGGPGTSLEGTVAHEFNHDLDRTSNGTWGRHVNACKAAGPDPNWPYGTDPAIHEYGFDTRLPWQNTSSSKTVVPTSYPDLMSYCQSGALPTKWVGPYRYNNWLSSGFPLAPVKTGNNAPTVVPVDSLYLSGSVDVTGTGKLDPALLAPGVPIALSASGAYTLTLLGSGGATLAKQAFDITFQDVEGNPLPTVFFDFVLQDPGGVTGYRLLHAGQTLASVDRSAAAPAAAFTFPTGGENLTGTVNVAWTLSDTDTPLADLRQNLEYSADNGNTWMPVAANLPGSLTSYALDSGLLPKSTQGKLRLWVTDGLNNVQVDTSGVFSVPDHAPLANILSPRDDGFIPKNSPMLLQGQASDVEEPDLPDNNFLWVLDGTTTLGIGRSVQVVLPTGKHTISLTVLDSDGLSGTANVTVFVDQFRVFLSLIAK